MNTNSEIHMRGDKFMFWRFQKFRLALYPVCLVTLRTTIAMSISYMIDSQLQVIHVTVVLLLRLVVISLSGRFSWLSWKQIFWKWFQRLHWSPNAFKYTHIQNMSQPHFLMTMNCDLTLVPSVMVNVLKTSFQIAKKLAT